MKQTIILRFCVCVVLTKFFVLDDALEDDDDKVVSLAAASNAGASNQMSAHFLDKDRLTKQERLAVECLKPRLQVRFCHFFLFF